MNAILAVTHEHRESVLALRIFFSILLVIVFCSGLAPSDSHESAIQATLLGGSYTAVVGTVTGDPGTAVVEVYQLP